MSDSHSAQPDVGSWTQGSGFYLGFGCHPPVDCWHYNWIGLATQTGSGSLEKVLHFPHF